MITKGKMRRLIAREKRARVLAFTVPLQTGAVCTVPSFGLLAPVTFAKTGGNANLSINAATGAISATAALTAGASQILTGKVTGADGCVIPFVATLTGAVAALAPVIARPAVTGTVYTVNTGMTSAAIAAVYAGMAAGDCIQFDDGTYDQNACFPNGFNKPGTIIRAKNIGAYDANPLGDGGTRHWARFTRRVMFEYGADIGGVCSQVASGVTIHDIHHTTKGSLWPEENANWNSTVNNLTAFVLSLSNFGFISIPTGISNVDLLYNEFSMGYGPDKIPFDPTHKYIDCNSPATFSLSTGGAITAGAAYTGWGDATYLTYNRMLWGPYGVLASKAASNVRIYGNYFHDMSHCINGVLPGSGTYLQQHNWMERSYHDFGTISSGLASSPDITIAQNIWIDPCGHPKDHSNPHIDASQIFWAITGGGQVRPKLIKLLRCLLLSSSDLCRGAAQFGFLQLSAGHYAAANTNDIVAIAPKIRENISLHSGYAPALELGVSEDAYVRGNIALHRSALNNGTSPVATQATIDKSYNAISARPNKGLFADNIYEADVAGPGAGVGLIADLAKSNNAIMGRRDARTISEATIFAGYSESCPANPHQLFEYIRRNGGFTQGNKAANIADFILAPMDWSAEPPFLGFLELVEQAAGTTILSNPAWLHGGNPGQVRTIAPGAGVEWRKLDQDRATVVADWSSAAGTAAVDSGYIQLRVTAPTQGTAQTFTVAVDGVAQEWHVSSASTAAFARVLFDGADRFVRSAGALGADSAYMTLAFKARFPSANPGASVQLYGTVASGNAAIQLQLLSTGLLRMTVRDAAGTAIAQINHSGASLCDGGVHSVFITLDLSQATAASGRKVVIDGVDVTSATGTWTGGEGITIGYSRTTGPLQYAIGGTTTLMVSDFAPDFLWLSIAERIDATSPTVRAKFAADQIGAAGEGPTGNPPVGFFTGNAGAWNAGAGINLGTGAKYIAAAGSAVADA